MHFPLRFLFSALVTALTFTAQAFEPLNTDDAGTVGYQVNQIEQYVYLLNNKTAGDISVIY